MTYLYGDSTPFPHDVDYIEVCKRAVDCAVQLLSVQHAITEAVKRSERVTENCETEFVRVDAMQDALEQCMAPFSESESARTIAAAGAATQRAKAVLSEAREALNGELSATETLTRRAIERMGDSARRALGSFLSHHDLPGTQTVLRLEHRDDAHHGRLRVETPFGVAAELEVEVPSDGKWGRPRQARDLESGMAIRVHSPAKSLLRAWSRDRIKLDRFYFGDISLAPSRGVVDLRRAAGHAAGYRLCFASTAA